MNWNGGALARANLKRQFADNRQNNRRNFGESRGHDENEGERRGAGTGANVNPGETQVGVPKRPRGSAAFNDRALDDHGIGRQHQDYAALGFELLEPQKYERRVVPLLEFLEKKFPKGHLLSLQLSHQMDITRVPIVAKRSSNPEASTSSNNRSENVGAQDNQLGGGVNLGNI